MSDQEKVSVAQERTNVVSKVGAQIRDFLTHRREVKAARQARRRPEGWYFPELEGPDLSTELAPGEADLWEELANGKSIADIWDLDLDDYPRHNDARTVVELQGADRPAGYTDDEWTSAGTPEAQRHLMFAAVSEELEGGTPDYGDGWKQHIPENSPEDN